MRGHRLGLVLEAVGALHERVQVLLYHIQHRVDPTARRRHCGLADSKVLQQSGNK